MSASIIPRYNPDDLRRFAAALGTARGLAPPSALALAAHLLWYDAAGAAILGIASLPDWLEALAEGRFDLKTVGRVVGERPALAHFDGENGLPPLILERAAELAVEKAREAAVGLVRVEHLGPIHSAAAVTAGIARGPWAGLVLGPNHLWSIAWPTGAGLPALVDSGLAALGTTEQPSGDRAGGTAAKSSPPRRPRSTSGTGAGPPADPIAGLWLGAQALIPAGGWLVAAVSVAALEPLATVHQRVASVLQDHDERAGWLMPGAWDERRRAVRQQGIAVPAPAWKALNHWAVRLAVAVPAGLTQIPLN